MPGDAPHDLHIFMSQVTDEMAAEYRRIYARSAQDPGTAGDEGESNWASMLREWLPPNYHVVTKGRIIAHDKRISPQIDVLVLKPWYPKKLMEKKIWLAAGVAAAFECKNTLNAKNLRETLLRCLEFKKLYAPREGSPREELQSPILFGLLAHSHAWKGVESEPLVNIQNVFEGAQEKILHPREEIDFICIADLASWTRTYMCRYDTHWLSQDPGERLAIERQFGHRIAVTTALLCAAFGAERQSGDFRPIGAFMSALTQKMGFEDPALRDLADYYRLAKLWGAGHGKMRFWPITVYSERTRLSLPTKILSEDTWDAWSVTG